MCAGVGIVSMRGRACVYVYVTGMHAQCHASLVSGVCNY